MCSSHAEGRDESFQSWNYQQAHSMKVKNLFTSWQPIKYGAHDYESKCQFMEYYHKGSPVEKTSKLHVSERNF